MIHTHKRQRERKATIFKYTFTKKRLGPFVSKKFELKIPTTERIHFFESPFS